MNKIVTREQLVELLKEQRSATFVTIVTATLPRMNKTDNPYYGKVEKIARRNGVICAIYENSINSARIKEGKEPDFKADKLPFGEHFSPCLIKHKGEFYLKYRPKTNFEEFYMNLESREIIPKEKLQQFFPKQSNQRQQLDNPISWLTIKLQSLRNITVSGNQYEIV